jgi:hypothetical protein
VNVCLKCGYDPGAIVLRSWQHTIKRDPPSLNARVFNSGPRAYAYRAERDVWAWEFRSMRLALKIPTTTNTVRRITFTRYYSGRQQERDRDNLIGGLKCAVDALVLEHLLVDDSPQWAELHYMQQRLDASSNERCGLGVLVEEFDAEARR